ncbi:histidine phosphatase family protein [Microbispora sp. NPDC088329]|uniref:histidine phosphatase family protein n=1 Tax=Microbispora sp. NPDC088329 TaxID=3154869 RepID=UPI00341F4189
MYLVRHGQQDQALGRSGDGGLSELGRRQADRLGQRLRDVPFSAVHHSPLLRAVQTADVIAVSVRRVRIFHRVVGRAARTSHACPGAEAAPVVRPVPCTPRTGRG